MKKYKNKEWLGKEYLENKRSMREIGEKCGVSAATIKYWMVKNKIPVRTSAEAHHVLFKNHCNIMGSAIEFINGELLGDMCVRSKSRFSARISYSSKHKKYLEWLSRQLSQWEIKQSGRLAWHNVKWSQNKIWGYSSCYYPELLRFINFFYPNGKKIVPRDIELTPLVCRQWYIGDGHKDQRNGWNPSIVMATGGFIEKDVEFLAHKLSSLNIKAKRTKTNNIYIPVKSTQRFFKHIGPCPKEIEDIYGYKWPTNSSISFK